MLNCRSIHRLSQHQLMFVIILSWCDDINEAQFRPHTDNGAGAGQSNSLIVGLGNYAGGELMVEGVKKDIRYNPIEFDGWKERHWTLPFKGERFSLVWFTPKGCEGKRGIDLYFENNV